MLKRMIMLVIMASFLIPSVASSQKLELSCETAAECEVFKQEINRIKQMRFVAKGMKRLKRRAANGSGGAKRDIDFFDEANVKGLSDEFEAMEEEGFSFENAYKRVSGTVVGEGANMSWYAVAKVMYHLELTKLRRTPRKVSRSGAISKVVLRDRMITVDAEYESAEEGEEVASEFAREFIIGSARRLGWSSGGGKRKAKPKQPPKAKQDAPPKASPPPAQKQKGAYYMPRKRLDRLRRVRTANSHNGYVAGGSSRRWKQPTRVRRIVRKGPKPPPRNKVKRRASY